MYKFYLNDFFQLSFEHNTHRTAHTNSRLGTIKNFSQWLCRHCFCSNFSWNSKINAWFDMTMLMLNTLNVQLSVFRYEFRIRFIKAAVAVEEKFPTYLTDRSEFFSLSPVSRDDERVENVSENFHFSFIHLPLCLNYCESLKIFVWFPLRPLFMFTLLVACFFDKRH